MNVLEKKCLICNTIFTPKNSHPRQKYCSPQCRVQSHLLSKGTYSICEKCGNPFLVCPSKVAQRKYCSSVCANNTNTAISKKCIYCSKEFIVKKYRVNTAKWCNKECYNKHRTQSHDQTPGWRGGPQFISFCKVCGTEIHAYRPRTFCSHICAGRAKQKRIEIICARCGKPFTRHIGNINRRYCSIDCFHKALVNGTSAASEECFKIVLGVLKNPPYQREKTWDWLKSSKGWPLWVDLYIPRFNLAIEYDGEQHFNYSTLFYKSPEDFEYSKQTDILKETLCTKNKVYFLRFTYKDKIDMDSVKYRLENIIPHIKF